MSDLIKREDAKVAVMWGNGLDGSVVDDICEKIDAIPSADRPQDREQFGKTEQLRGRARLERPNVGRSNRDRANYFQNGTS